MKNLLKNVDYWLAIEGLLIVVAGLWLFLLVVGIYTPGCGKETVRCWEWFLESSAGAYLIYESRLGKY